jgi:regulatory protein
MAGDPLREKAENKAYRLLALRAHSERELRRKLLAGGFPEGIVSGVIGKCRQSGYLDDGLFARQRARDLAVNRLAGDRRIAADLRERGIGEDLVREAIAAVRREVGEAEALERLLLKKTKGMALAALDGRQKARLARGLLGKGFPAGLIFKRLNNGQESGTDDDDRQ